MGVAVRVEGSFTLTSYDVGTLLMSIRHDSVELREGGCTMERQARRATALFELEQPIAFDSPLHISLFAARGDRCLETV